MTERFYLRLYCQCHLYGEPCRELTGERWFEAEDFASAKRKAGIYAASCKRIGAYVDLIEIAKTEKGNPILVRKCGVWEHLPEGARDE